MKLFLEFGMKLRILRGNDRQILCRIGRHKLPDDRLHVVLRNKTPYNKTNQHKKLGKKTITLTTRAKPIITETTMTTTPTIIMKTQTVITKVPTTRTIASYPKNSSQHLTMEQTTKWEKTTLLS